jgi:hypothetical protein
MSPARLLLRAPAHQILIMPRASSLGPTFVVPTIYFHAAHHPSRITIIHRHSPAATRTSSCKRKTFLLRLFLGRYNETPIAIYATRPIAPAERPDTGLCDSHTKTASLGDPAMFLIPRAHGAPILPGRPTQTRQRRGQLPDGQCQLRQVRLSPLSLQEEKWH